MQLNYCGFNPVWPGLSEKNVDSVNIDFRSSEKKINFNNLFSEPY